MSSCLIELLLWNNVKWNENQCFCFCRRVKAWCSTTGPCSTVTPVQVQQSSPPAYFSTTSLASSRPSSRSFATCPPPPHRPWRGARQQPLPPGQHSSPSPSADPGRVAARGRRCAGVPVQHPASAALLHREEDPAREPGDRSHRERLQRDGEGQVQGRHRF